MPPSIPSTYLTPKHGRPCRATLSESLGFKVPARFAEVVGRLYDFAGGDPALCLKVLDASLGVFPNGPDARYWGTPPELFPIGSTGCDGDHYGFLLHAPELEMDDLPYAHYCPMDSDGVIVVGSSTERGIASVMAQNLSYELDGSERKDLIAQLAKACNINPHMEHNPVTFVPQGWRLSLAGGYQPIAVQRSRHVAVA